jgi:hypothetical protein
VPTPNRFVLTVELPIRIRKGRTNYRAEMRCQETSRQWQLAAQHVESARYWLLAFAGTNADLSAKAYTIGFDVPAGIGSGWVMGRLCAEWKARQLSWTPIQRMEATKMRSIANPRR